LHSPIARSWRRRSHRFARSRRSSMQLPRVESRSRRPGCSRDRVVLAFERRLGPLVRRSSTLDARERLQHAR
jgi:hypothetical protein